MAKPEMLSRSTTESKSRVQRAQPNEDRAPTARAEELRREKAEVQSQPRKEARRAWYPRENKHCWTVCQPESFLEEGPENPPQETTGFPA